MLVQWPCVGGSKPFADSGTTDGYHGRRSWLVVLQPPPPFSPIEKIVMGDVSDLVPACQ